MALLSIGDALKKMVKESRLKNGLRTVQIEDIWKEIMGVTIANYTDKLQIVNGVLFVYTTVGPLKNEIAYQKAKIIERVNESFGEKAIHDVVIR